MQINSFVEGLGSHVFFIDPLKAADVGSVSDELNGLALTPMS